MSETHDVVNPKSKIQNPKSAHQTVLILDFGSQFTQLIARRVRENRVYCEVHPFDLPLEEIRRRQPVGLILSGGPPSVYEAGAPSADPELFDLGVPVLGICYGMQLLAHALGGRRRGVQPPRVRPRRDRDHRARPAVRGALRPRDRLDEPRRPGARRCRPAFLPPAGTDTCPVAAVRAPGAPGLRPPVPPRGRRTPPSGGHILRNFLYGVCGARGDWTMAHFHRADGRRRSASGSASDRVICGLSGGVDSSVAAALLQARRGRAVVCIFVDNGLLREGEAVRCCTSLRDGTRGSRSWRSTPAERFLAALAGVADPQEKRKLIGHIFIDVFKDEAQSDRRTPTSWPRGRSTPT